MPESEEEFQKHMVKLLKSSRTLIEEEYRPFNFAEFTVDIKSLFNQLEEWRENTRTRITDITKRVQRLESKYGIEHHEVK